MMIDTVDSVYQHDMAGKWRNLTLLALAELLAMGLWFRLRPSSRN
jgi:hypothetical protein